jgi:outer membrane protein, multidrug efflux system
LSPPSGDKGAPHPCGNHDADPLKCGSAIRQNCSLPSDLLRRRPDVRAAERELAVATAEIGVSVSDLNPKFDLICAVAFTGGGIGNLVSGGNLGEVGLGSITWPVFHCGQSCANDRAKEEEAKQAYYASQKTVLGAVQNVEAALARYTTEQQRLVALERSSETLASPCSQFLQQLFGACNVRKLIIFCQRGLNQ